MTEFINSDVSFKNIIEDEGIQARNLIKYNVPLHARKKTDYKSNNQRLDDDTQSPLPPQECGDISSQSSLTPLIISNNKFYSKISDYRSRYWGQMMDTLKRTIDEIYSACETDESEVECKEVIMILEHSKKDFFSLIEKMNLFKEIENSTSDSRPCCIAWDERKISPGKPIMKQVLEKSKRANSLSGQSSSTMSQTEMTNSATNKLTQTSFEESTTSKSTKNNLYYSSLVTTTNVIDADVEDDGESDGEDVNDNDNDEIDEDNDEDEDDVTFGSSNIISNSELTRGAIKDQQFILNNCCTWADKVKSQLSKASSTISNSTNASTTNNNSNNNNNPIIKQRIAISNNKSNNNNNNNTKSSNLKNPKRLNKSIIQTKNTITKSWNNRPLTGVTNSNSNKLYASKDKRKKLLSANAEIKPNIDMKPNEPDSNEWAIVNRTKSRQSRLSNRSVLSSCSGNSNVNIADYTKSTSGNNNQNLRNHTFSDRPSRRINNNNNSNNNNNRNNNNNNNNFHKNSNRNNYNLKRNKSKSETNLQSKKTSNNTDKDCLKNNEIFKITNSDNKEYDLENRFLKNFSVSSTSNLMEDSDENLLKQSSSALVISGCAFDNNLDDEDEEETNRNINQLNAQLADVESKENELQNELGRARKEEAAVRKTIEHEEEKENEVSNDAVNTNENFDGIVGSITMNEKTDMEMEVDENDDGYDIVLNDELVKQQSYFINGILAHTSSSTTSSISNLLIPLEDIRDKLQQTASSMDWSQITDDLDDDTEADDSVTKLRTPGRCVDLHQKLSAPLRKRSINSIQQLEEKQAKAKEIREKILLDRTEKVRELTKKVEEVRLHKSTLMDERKSLMETRLEKAEKKRQQQLDERVKKAHDEEIKGKEIAFIQSLEAEQKQYTIFAKHQESEARLLERQEERKKKMEEKADREAAAEIRRKKLETTRQAWLEELQQRWKHREEELASKAEYKERQRRDAVKAKEAEREMKKIVLEQHQKTHIEQLKEKIFKKHEDSERRYQEQLAEISRKAFEMSVTQYSVEETSDAPAIEPYLNKKWCNACNVMIDSDILLQSHLNGKKHKHFVKEQLLGDFLETDQIKKFNLEHLVDASDDKTDPKLQAKKERRKTVKKKIKKFKQRIMNKNVEFEQFCAQLKNEKIFPSTVNKSKYLKFIKDVRRILSIQDTGPWVNVRVSTLEKSLSELFRCWENIQNIQQEQNYLLSIDLFNIFNSLILLISSQKSENTPILPEKTVCIVTKSIRKLVADNYCVCYYVLYSSIIVNLIDVLQFKLQYLIPDHFLTNMKKLNSSTITTCTTNNTINSSISPNNREMPTNNIVEHLLDNITMIFNCFVAANTEHSISLATSKSNKAVNNIISATINPDLTKLQHIISYIISIGIVDKLSDYLSQVRGPLKENSPTAHFVLVILSFLSSLLKVLALINPHKPTSGCGDEPMSRVDCKPIGNQSNASTASSPVPYTNNLLSALSNQENQLLLSIEENEMCGLICLLYGLLLYQGNSESKFDPLPPLTGKITIAGLNLINNLAVVSLSTMQNVLSQEGIYLQLRHILSFLISYCTKYLSTSSISANVNLSSTNATSILSATGSASVNTNYPAKLSTASLTSYSQDSSSSISSNANQSINVQFNVQEMLHEIILCVGYFCVNNNENQSFIQTGQRPTILQQLCQLPFPYFSQRHLTQCLYPTLISCCYNNQENTAVLELEMTCDLLSTFIQDRISNISSEKAIIEPGDSRFHLQQRFPVKDWQNAKIYFERN